MYSFINNGFNPIDCNKREELLIFSYHNFQSSFFSNQKLSIYIFIMRLENFMIYMKMKWIKSFACER